ncbi:MAG: M1 family aminopeptidase [Gemmatimonadota bacterium]
MRLPTRRPAAALELLVALAILAPLSASAQTIGAYTPPKVWPERPRRFDLIHQRIAIGIDWSHRQVNGQVLTTIVATAPADTVRLDAANINIESATSVDGKKLKFSSDSTHVTVKLAKKFAAGDTVSFSLKYNAVPERGLYFVPRRHIVWSQGEAIETRSWIPTYDFPNDKTTWEFLVTADTGQSVLSNGRLADVKKTADGRQQVWHWVQDAPASTYLYSVVIGPLVVLHDQWRGRPVDYWVSGDTVDAAWRTFGETPSMLEIYSQVLGVNYAWPKYAQSVIPDFTYGGMENVSATTQTDLVLHGPGGEPEQGGRGLAAHELAHQWFGDLTTTATWSNAWLNEGLTTYMESVQNEKSRGWSAGQLSWWGQQQQAMAADLNQVRPLVWGDTTGDPIQTFFSGHIYPKGAQVAHQMRRLLGDSLFWAGMRRFLTDNAYKPVLTADLAIAFEKTANRDLDWFFDQWCYGIGYPKVKVERKWDGSSKSLAVTVTETQPIDSTHPLFRFPVTIRIITADSVVRREIMVTRQQETFSLTLPGEPLSFRFDEGAWLLGTVSTDQTPAELSDMARHDLEFGARNWALRALDKSTDTTAEAARRLIVLNEREPSLREEALRQIRDGKNPASLSVVRSALRDPVGSVRSQALFALSAFDSAGVIPIARVMLQDDPNDAVRQQAAVLLDPASTMDFDMLIKRTSSEWPLGLRQTAAFQISKQSDPQVVPALVKLTDPSEPRNLRQAALNFLAGRADKADAITTSTKYLGDPDPLFASAAVRTLARVGGDAGKAKLTATLATEKRVTVRTAIQGALKPQM